MTVYEAYKMVTQNGLAKKLYDYIEHEYSEEAVMADLEHGYLTMDSMTRHIFGTRMRSARGLSASRMVAF